MKTNALILAAALSAAGLATSLAQPVYSDNIVGYVKVEIPPNYSIIANPLIAPTNTIPNLFPGVPINTIIYKFADGAYSGINALRPGALGWANKGMTLVPGEAVFIYNPGTNTLTNTFIGEVATGNLTNVIPKGFSMISSMVPQTGRLTRDLGYVTGTGVQQIYQFDPNPKNAYAIKSTLPSGVWIGGDPVIKVGEGFFINVPTERKWTRTFTIGN